MQEVFWNWSMAMVEVIVGLKTRIAKYVAYILNNRVYTHAVNIGFQYFLRYFNYLFQDAM